MKDLLHKFLVRNSSINVEFPENMARKTTAVGYLISISKIVSGVQQIGAGVLIIINNYFLGLIWASDSKYPYYSQRKDENGNSSSSGMTDLLQFDMLHSLENYTKSVYYNTFPLTSFFQVKFTKVNCTANAKNAIKYELKKEQLLARLKRVLLVKKGKYLDDPKKIKIAIKKRYHNKNESIRQHSKEKYLKNQTSKSTYQKVKCQENPEVHLI